MTFDFLNALRRGGGGGSSVEDFFLNFTIFFSASLTLNYNMGETAFRIFSTYMTKRR